MEELNLLCTAIHRAHPSVLHDILQMVLQQRTLLNVHVLLLLLLLIMQHRFLPDHKSIL